MTPNSPLNLTWFCVCVSSSALWGLNVHQSCIFPAHFTSALLHVKLRWLVRFCVLYIWFERAKILSSILSSLLAEWLWAFLRVVIILSHQFESYSWAHLTQDGMDLALRKSSRTLLWTLRYGDYLAIFSFTVKQMIFNFHKHGSAGDLNSWPSWLEEEV